MNKNLFDLSGKVAIVTGGNGGIGYGISVGLAQAGANIMIAARNQEKIDSSLGNLRKLNTKSSGLTVDVTNEDSVINMVDQTINEFGKVDILINNAGVIRDRSFMKMSQEEWDTVININLTGMFIVTKAVFPIMKEAGYGRIISASSINAFQGAFGQANYSTTKAGISGFTRALCKEGGKYGITVNAVAPGFIKSLMSDSMPDEIIKAGISQIPVGRIGTPKDMGYTYLFLASKEAGFISGITLHANGGAMPM